MDLTPLVETLQKFVETDGYTRRLLYARTIADLLRTSDLVGDPILSAHSSYLVKSLSGEVLSTWQHQTQAAKEMLVRLNGMLVMEELFGVHNDESTTSYGSFQ